MKYSFYKYHGCKNDYIYFDRWESPFPPTDLIPDLCDRHGGIGGDGAVFISPSDLADGRMVMYNRDGSRGRFCGNALRCVAAHLSERLKRSDVTVETDSGVIPCMVHSEEKPVFVSCRLDPPRFSPDSIPIRCAEPVIGKDLPTPWGTFEMTCVGMGNPHCVLFTHGKEFPFDPVTSYVSSLSLFPEGINVEMAERDGTGLFYRVLERGSGETLSCGSGACAVAAAAVKTGLFRPGERISVSSKGGTLHITVTDQNILLEGPCKKVFSGWFEQEYI